MDKMMNNIMIWKLGSHERDAIVAKEAIQQGGSGLKAIVEIFIGRKSTHISLIKQAYYHRYGTHLDQDVLTLDPPHPFQKITVALSTSHKALESDVSQHIAKCDARRLFETGEGNSSTSSASVEEAVVLEILSKRSVSQMKLTFSTYKQIYGHHYTKCLKRGNSTEFEDSLRMVVKCILNPPNYYSKILYESIKGKKVGDLGRVIVSRGEIQMDDIHNIFKRKYGVELGDAISQTITCTEYRDFLLHLVNKSTSR